MSTPMKPGWYRAQWDFKSPIVCVRVAVDVGMLGSPGRPLKVHDTFAGSWRPLACVAEWGLCIDDIEVEVTSLRARAERAEMALFILRADRDAVRAKKQMRDESVPAPGWILVDADRGKYGRLDGLTDLAGTWIDYDETRRSDL